MRKRQLYVEIVLFSTVLACKSSVTPPNQAGRSGDRLTPKIEATVPRGVDGGPPVTAAAPSGAQTPIGQLQTSPLGPGSITVEKAAAAPAQLVVKFISEGPFAVTECPERWIAEGRSFQDATADRSDSLDQLRRQIGVTQARALMAGRSGLSTASAKALFASRWAAVRARFSTRSARAPFAVQALAGGRGDLTNVYVLGLPTGADARAAAQRFSQDSHVAYAQVNYRAVPHLVPNDPYYATAGSWGQSGDDLWGLKKINTSRAWDSSQGEGVVIAVVDTGLDLGHPDITANLWTNPGEIAGNGIDDDHNGFIDDVHGWNFVANSADPTDDFGHGTHVSGIIAAVGNNAQGVIGVAPGSHVMAVKALDANGNATVDALAQAIVYAADNGADVINNSWGCSSAYLSNPVVEDAVAMAHDLGIVVVFSAGNSGKDVIDYSPQNQPEVIVVSASDPSDQITFFSNVGFVDVAAPGGGTNVAPPAYDPFRNILSLKAAGCGADICPPDLVVGGAYLRQAGTSMAAPYVAGLAALVLKQNPSYSPEEIRQVLRRSATDVGTAGVDLGSGYGRIDAASALAEPRPLSVLLTAPLGQLIGVTSADVTGTAQGIGFASWVLEEGIGTLPTSFSPVASSTLPVSSGMLATWNLANAVDGIHTLRLTATTSDGRSYEDRQRVTVDNVIITAPPAEPLAFFRGDPASIIGTVAPANFSNYTLAVSHSDGTPLAGANLTLANGGTRQVRNGTLATWNTAGVPADQYTLTLTVTLSAGDPIIRTAHAAVDPTLHPGWPVRLDATGGWMAALADHLTAADVNGDGAAELVIAYGSTVRILDHTGAVIPGWPQTVDPSGTGAMAQMAPAVGDVTGDGIPEVVVQNNAGRVFVWQANGVLLSGWPILLGIDENSIAIADIDGDGRAEIVTTGWPGSINVFASNGNSLPGWRFTPQPSANLTAPAIGDVDGDGKKEIAVAISNDAGATPGYLYLLSSTGAVLPGWPQAINPPSGTVPSFSYPTLGDLDGDGKLDVAIGALNGTVFAFHHTGVALAGWPQATPGGETHTPALGDLDGDGRLEIVAGGNTVIDSSTGVETDFLSAWRYTGSLLSGWPVKVNSDSTTVVWSRSFGFGSSVIADLDGDGVSDIVVASDSFSPSSRIYSLRGYRSDGSVLPGFPKVTADVGTFATGTAAVADFDGDGKLELAWVDNASSSGVFTFYLWDLDAPATSLAPWPMYQHDAAHTGCATPFAAPPTGLVATAGDAKVTLIWNASPAATRYDVLRSTTSGSGYATVASGITATSYVNTGLSNGTTYYYVVTAANAAGTSRYSNQAYATPMAIPPAPTGLLATAGNAQVSLSWTAAAGATSYNVLRSTSKGSGYQPVVSGITTTSYVNTGLSNGTTYYYVVTASNSAGTSGYSNEASATPKVTVPAPPSGLVATAGNAQVSLSWTAAAGATSYNVLRSTTKGSGYRSVATGVTSPSYVNTGLTNGTTYYYVVTATNSAGTSGYSNEASATPKVTVPAPPSGLVATAGNAQVSLTWSASTGATSYSVLRSTTKGSGYKSVVTGVTGTSYVNTGLTNGTTYYYVVTATNSAGTSGYSNEASATPKLPAPPAPTGLAATAGNAQVSLSWNAASGATSYSVLRSTTNGSGYNSVATGLTTTSYVNTGLTNGTTYYYVVTASNAGGTSGYSNQASATPGAALPCTGAITVTGGQSGNFNTTSAVCYRTADTINGWGCSNFAGRTVAVNKVAEACGAMPLPAKWSDGYRYFAISAGTYSYASFYWW